MREAKRSSRNARDNNGELHVYLLRCMKHSAHKVVLESNWSSQITNSNLRNRLHLFTNESDTEAPVPPEPPVASGPTRPSEAPTASDSEGHYARPRREAFCKATDTRAARRAHAKCSIGW